jgi:lysophospholipase L1-like esterase
MLDISILMLGGYFVYKKGGLTYLQLKISEVIHNEYKLSAYHALYQSKYNLFTRLPHSNQSIIFVGDSLIRGCEWSEMFGNLNIKNRGIGGDSLTGVLSRLDEIIERQPKKIFLMIGINDLKKGKSVPDILIDYNKIVTKIKNDIPETTLYIQSILPVNEFLGTLLLGSKLKNVNNQTIQEINKGLRQQVRKDHIQYIDLYSFFVKNEQLDKQYTIDGLHLNGDGYLIWKQVLMPYI